jgi:diguanylate cyclase (GGDEF)-like protein/PAS domain S-box-containing protein
MSRQLCLITCASFDREVLTVQSAPDFQDIRFKILPVDCDQVESQWPGLGQAVALCGQASCLAGLVGGYCLTRPSKDLGLDGTSRLHQKSQCFEWIVDKDVLDRFLQEGALPVLPGWLRDWETHVERRWPSGHKAARAFFRELARKVVLLDTGVHPNSVRELKSFARFLHLPCEVHPVGLEHFRLSLARIVLSWRVEQAKEDAEDLLAAFRQQIADFARIGPLLGNVTSARNVEEAQTGVLDLFRTLLSPCEVLYYPLESFSIRPDPEGSPRDRIVVLNADYAWSEDRRTVYLKVAHDRELLGILEIVGFGGPERRDQDLNLALSLARISGLALVNVGRRQAFAEERDKAVRAEAALAAGEERMTRIFNYPLGLYRTTPGGQILDATPTLARMLGYPDLEALKAVNFWDFHHNPSDRDNWQAVLDSSPMVEIFETQLRRKNGTLFWAKDASRAAKDAHGKVLFYDGVIEDITRKKQIEEDHSWDVRLQASVGDVSERLLSPVPIEEMSALIMEHARRLTSSATAIICHIDERTGRFVPAAMTPDAREMLADHPGDGNCAHKGSEMWNWIIEKQKPILTNVPSLDPRYTGMPGWHFPVRHFLAVPAFMSGLIVGLIVLANPHEPYVDRDLKAVERLATLYAIAIQRARAENELRDLSLVDDLTKLYNRRGFMTLAEQQLKVANRTKKEMALFYADLDDLKRINDTFGHDEGDVALVEAAAMLRNAFRDSDILARFGGDEFVVLAIDVPVGKGASLSRRLREQFVARNARSGQDYMLSFSLGVVRYDPEEPVTIAELLTRADRLMYKDKSSKKAAAAAA